MRYSDDLIEEIRSANDIVDVISQYVRLQRRGANYFGLCPFHNEKSPSFSVSPSKQMYYCFGCGEGGNVITFLMKYENETFQEALRKLADRAGIRLPEPEMSGEARAESDRRGKLLEINKLAAEYFYRKLRTPAGKNAMDYLKNRGLSDEIIHSFGLGYSDRYSDDLYRFIKKRGYADELLKVLEPGDVSHHGCEPESDRFRRQGYGRGEAQVPEFSGNSYFRQKQKPVRALCGKKSR